MLKGSGDGRINVRLRQTGCSLRTRSIAGLGVEPLSLPEFWIQGRPEFGGCRGVLSLSLGRTPGAGGSAVAQGDGLRRARGCRNDAQRSPS